jgi:CubicO group peptidase (beta-lactamase class C family)
VAFDTYPALDWVEGELDPSVDAEALDGVISLLASQPSDLATTLALVVVHNGRVVREMYGPETDASATLISWSMAKSITQALVGMAVGDGLLSIHDDHLFPEWENDDRANITLGNLLNMTSGLEWLEDYVDDKASDVIEMLFDDKKFVGDHAAYAASKNLEAKPGTKYLYSSGTTNLVTKILSRAVGEKPGSSDAMSEFMQERLFDPLGMQTAIPRFDASGNFVGSSYVYATARDFARFGYLYLNDGMWDGSRLLPEGWVDYSRTPIARDPENDLDYGAHVWMFPNDPGSIAALGYEGQFTWVSPERNLVVVRLGKTNAEYAPRLREELSRIVQAFPTQGSDFGNDGHHG